MVLLFFTTFGFIILKIIFKLLIFKNLLWNSINITGVTHLELFGVVEISVLAMKLNAEWGFYFWGAGF